LDGNYIPTNQETNTIKALLKNGADVWIWAPTPASIANYQSFLPDELSLQSRTASSFIPVQKSWLKNTVNSDFYFSEIQTGEASQYGMTGDFVTEGEVLLNACKTDWRKWNKRAEELKTAAVLRSENEAHGPDAVFVKYPAHGSTFYVSTLDNFTASEKGYNTLEKILHAAGIPTGNKQFSNSLIDARGEVQLSNLLVNNQDNRNNYSLWVYSPRPLDDLLIEPDMPKLDIVTSGKEEIKLNGKKLESYK
jgi:beta-galactosidase